MKKLTTKEAAEIVRYVQIVAMGEKGLQVTAVTRRYLLEMLKNAVSASPEFTYAEDAAYLPRILAGEFISIDELLEIGNKRRPWEAVKS
jgi:hypothetical protein